MANLLLSVSDATVLIDLPLDSTQLTEATTVTNPIDTINLNEAVTVTEHSTINLYELSIAETITDTEATTIVVPILPISVSDTVTDTETVTVGEGAEPLITSDSTTLTEQVTMLLPALFISVTNAVTDTEATQIFIPVLDLSVNDSVTTLDQPTLVLPLLFLSVSDSATVQDILNPTGIAGGTTIVIAGSPVVITSGNIVGPTNDLANGRYIITVAVKTVANKCRSSRGFTFQPLYVSVTNGVLGPMALVPTACLTPNQPYIVKFYSKGPEGNRFRTLTKANVPNVGGPIDFSVLFQ